MSMWRLYRQWRSWGGGRIAWLRMPQAHRRWVAGWPLLPPDTERRLRDWLASHPTP
jgi:hypothetical protein